MDYGEAVSRISEIHEHLAKGEVYRGFRSIPMAVSGLIGIVAAVVRPYCFDLDYGPGLVAYWSVVATLSALVGGSETAFNYIFRDEGYARRRTLKVLGQFLPCLAAGLGVTFCIAGLEAQCIALLPGLWSILFGLGLFAARPYLPRAIGWVALYYSLAGLILLLRASASPWGFDYQIGGVFGMGQIASALVFYWNLERNDHVAC